jgi:hypothetical protein
VLSLVAAVGSMIVGGVPTPASAAGVGTVCTTVGGGDPELDLRGCSDIANTGGSGSASPWQAQGVPAVVHWANGKSTTLSLTVTPVTKDERERAKHQCRSSFPMQEEVISGTVTADTTGSIKIGGGVKAEICFNIAFQSISLEPGTTFKIV